MLGIVRERCQTLAHPLAPAATPRHSHRADAVASAAMPRAVVGRIDCSRNAYNLVTRRREGTFYPDEIEIQEAHSKHRKLDSQAALSHPTRDRAADGLRPQVWPLRASRCDHDPGRLSPWSAGVGGLRPAMAADRAMRGPPARSPRPERDLQRAPNPR